MLMEEKLQELRLVHYQTYLLSGIEADAGEEVDELHFAAISLLRYPRRQEELRIERLEGRHGYRQAKREGRPTAFSSLNALKGNQSDRKEYLDLVERREDDRFGDPGTMVVLTLRK